MGKAEAVRLALNAVLAATFAPRCAACTRMLESPLGGAVCQWCWDDVRRGTGVYDGTLRQIIHAFKYEGRRSLAAPLGALLRERGAALLAEADAVVPVPLFPWRRLRRGFNQSGELARHLHRPLVHALWRVRPTASQTGLTAAERRRNVRGAFVLSPLLDRATFERCIGNRVVVVVDDVMTTGATLRACARVLEDAGAREVRVLTLAHADLKVRRYDGR